MTLKYFVVEYERPTGTLRLCKEFTGTDYAGAAKLRFERDLANREHPEVEIVLLGTDSLETLKKTHGRYFYTVSELAGQMLDYLRSQKDVA
jgi:hypothetical protein